MRPYHPCWPSPPFIECHEIPHRWQGCNHLGDFLRVCNIYISNRACVSPPPRSLSLDFADACVSSFYCLHENARCISPNRTRTSSFSPIDLWLGLLNRTLSSGHCLVLGAWPLKARRCYVVVACVSARTVSVSAYCNVNDLYISKERQKIPS